MQCLKSTALWFYPFLFVGLTFSKEAVSDKDDMEVCGIPVWHIYWEYPSMVIKQKEH